MALPKVKSPMLLTIDGLDYPVIEKKEDALRQLQSEKQMKIVPGATLLFEERGTVE